VTNAARRWVAGTLDRATATVAVSDKAHRMHATTLAAGLHLPNRVLVDVVRLTRRQR
jgi:hypothetical protein